MCIIVIFQNLIYLFFEKLITDNDHHMFKEFLWITMKLIYLSTNKYLLTNI